MRFLFYQHLLVCTGLFACSHRHVSHYFLYILKNNEAFVVTVRCLGHMCTDTHFGNASICNINLFVLTHFCICVYMCPHLCVKDKSGCFVTQGLIQFCKGKCSYDNCTSYRNNQPVKSCSFRSFSMVNKCMFI